MVDQSSRFAVPGQDASKPVENRGIYEVFDPRTGLFVGDVRTRVSDDGLTITNTTLPGHLLYDGRITRTTWQDETGAWYVDTHGTGNNVIPGMNQVNQWQGPQIFDYVDSQMRCSISMHHGLGC